MTTIQKDTINMMRSEGYSYSKIAQTLGISVNTVKSFCRRNKMHETEKIIKNNVIPESAIEDNNICRHCGERIVQIAKQKPKKFCSDKCRVAWWKNNADLINKKAVYKLTCKNCNKVFESYGNKDRKYCSHNCYIEDRFMKGGTEIDKRTI